MIPLAGPSASSQSRLLRIKAAALRRMDRSTQDSNSRRSAFVTDGHGSDVSVLADSVIAQRLVYRSGHWDFSYLVK